MPPDHKDFLDPKDPQGKPETQEYPGRREILVWMGPPAAWVTRERRETLAPPENKGYRDWLDRRAREDLQDPRGNKDQ